MTLNDLRTKRSLYHLLYAIPGFLLLFIFGRSLSTEWVFYRILFVMAILSVLLCIACIILGVQPKNANIYSIVSMLSYLFFIPMFSSLVLMILFGILYLFGIDLHPLA